MDANQHPQPEANGPLLPAHQPPQLTLQAKNLALLRALDMQ
jgi:hypothetical protein